MSPKIQILSIFVMAILFLRASLAQEKEVALTVYNNNLALVKEVRQIELSKGISQIKFQDVAAQIDPTSVYFTSLTSPDKVLILEQNYEYDLVSSAKILQKYVDQEISLAIKEDVSLSGRLLNASGNDIILQEPDGGIKILNRQTVDNLSFPSLPEGLITRPTLVWSVNCQQPGSHETEVGYLTSGIQWHAEYVGIVNKDDTSLELNAWVSIDNRSGATYENAQLKLVAGDVHRAREAIPYLRKGYAAAESIRPDQFEEKAFFEYHLYTLQRSATVADNQIKQISLFSPANVQVKKNYSYDGARDPRKVQVNLEFENNKANGLGIPLPKGKVRVYKRDDDQALVFVGEDFVDHTPKDEKLRVYVGDAFDIVGERIQQDRRTIGKTSWQETWQIKLRNHKEETVRVTIVEHLQVDWEILEKSHEFRKRDAQTIEFEVELAKDSEMTVEYTVRYNR